jgi:hypothetical protein
MEKHYKNYHIIEVRYLGPTNFKGARVSIFSPRFNERKIINFNYEMNSIADMAIDYLIKSDFNVIGKGESKDGYFIITDTFQPLNKES